MTLAARELVRIEGGTFHMGSDRHYREEAPVATVTVAPFRLAAREVTNAEFAAFVRETGYRTVAERPLDPALYPGAPVENLQPGSMVFTGTNRPVDLRDHTQWWQWVPGASWRHPRGPGSSTTGRANHPVVHVALEDVEAYAGWAGGRLPTEAEWEFAARGGLDGAEFTWGDRDTDDQEPLANVWIGQFPWRSSRPDGQYGTRPVGSYAPNGYGLHDMAGNVWEWTSDWWTGAREIEAGCCGGGGYRPVSEGQSRDRQSAIPQKVVKGGSHLCHRVACFRYRPAARQPQQVDTGMSHVGFRLAQDA
jgi:sulfatase modifying factor 1